MTVRVDIPDFTVELPPEWKTADWSVDHIAPIAEADLAYGKALLVMAMLNDGTNILALTWPSGQRLARMSPETGFAIEERFTGRSPQSGAAKIDEVWRLGVESMVRAGHEAERELGPATIKTDRDRARLLLSNAPGAAEGLRHAYDMYRESHPDCSFETFEAGVQIIAGWENE